MLSLFNSLSILQGGRLTHLPLCADAHGRVARSGLSSLEFRVRIGVRVRVSVRVIFSITWSRPDTVT